jgi:hypothetical protein
MRYLVAWLLGALPSNRRAEPSRVDGEPAVETSERPKAAPLDLEGPGRSSLPLHDGTRRREHHAERDPDAARIGAERGGDGHKAGR